MEDDNKKHPSLPTNYVTLVQLQERWLKEKERKEKEKQLQEEREEELKRKLADQKDSVSHRSGPHYSKSMSSNRLVWNRRDKPVALVSGVEVPGDGDKNADKEGQKVTSKKKRHPWRKKPNLEVEKEVIEKGGVAHALPENVDEEGKKVTSKKKKNPRKKPNLEVEKEVIEKGGVAHALPENVDQEGKKVTSKKKKHPRKKPNLEVEEEVIEKDGLAHSLPENVDEEDIGGRRNEESRGVGGGFRAKGNNLDQTVEVETKIRDLSVNARSGKGNGNSELRRTSTFHNRGNRGFWANWSDRFGRREVWKQRDSGIVWVKKGEVFNENAGTMQKSESSGSVSGL